MVKIWVVVENHLFKGLNNYYKNVIYNKDKKRRYKKKILRLQLAINNFCLIQRLQYFFLKSNIFHEHLIKFYLFYLIFQKV